MKIQLQLKLGLVALFALLIKFTYSQNIDDIFTVNDFEYKITSLTPNTVMVIGYMGTRTELEIPEKINDDSNIFTVTAIGVNTFWEKQLTSVTIPNGVTSIGQGAFYDNNLTHVEIPNSVTSIGKWSFRHNSLANVTMSENTISIGRWAFGNNNLTEVTIPSNVSRIGSVAFQHNNLNIIVVEAAIPPTIEVSTFKNRGRIDVIVPKDKIEAYQIAGWTGFKSMTYATEVGESFTSQDIVYVVTSLAPNTVKIKDYIGLATSVNIPETVWRDFTVTSIGDSAFEDNRLTEVTIPNSVTHVGYKAFADNQLTEITIPNSVTSIGAKAFRENNLIEISIPNSVTSIGDKAFKKNQLTSVSIPNSVTSIGLETFRKNQLTEVIIPNSVTSIGKGAFNFNQLTNVSIPSGVTHIGEVAFSFNQLTEVTIPNSMINIESNAFFNNPELAIIEVGATTPPELNANAFINANRNQIDLLVPSGTKEAYLANGWTGFKSITDKKVGDTFTVNDIVYEVTSVTPNNVMVIDYIGSSTIINIPETVLGGYAVTSINNYSFSHDYPYTTPKLTEVTIPNSVTNIGDGAFSSNELAEITIPNSVTNIGVSAFAYNILTKITIPNGVASIGYGAFSGNYLTEVIIPNSVTSIGAYAFDFHPFVTVTVEVKATVPLELDEDAFMERYLIDLIVPAGTIEAYLNKGWTGFKSISDGSDSFVVDDIEYIITSLDHNTVMVINYMGASNVINIPEMINYESSTYTVTIIGTLAFGVKGLTQVTIPNSVTSIWWAAFANNQLTEVTIPNSVIRIGKEAFRDNLLTEVTIPNSVTSIGEEVFSNNQLTEVSIPNSVTSIGEEAFRSNQLTEVTIPNSVTSIGWEAFRDNHLTEVVIPNSVTRIEGYAFRNNQLTQVAIPNSVTTIRWGAFRDNHLTEVVIPNSVTSIEGNAFYDNQLTEVSIPNSVTRIGKEAFRLNKLTEVTIPNSVTRIWDEAFRDNPNLATVVVQASVPPELHTDAFINADRNQIDLKVPDGTKETYLANGWTGFKFIAEITQVASQNTSIQQITTASVSTVKSAIAPIAPRHTNEEIDNISIFPNPAQDYVNIKLRDGQALKQANIYNMMGILVKTAHTLKIDISHLPSGRYIFELITLTGTRTTKQVIIN